MPPETFERQVSLEESLKERSDGKEKHHRIKKTDCNYQPAGN